MARPLRAHIVNKQGQKVMVEIVGVAGRFPSLVRYRWPGEDDAASFILRDVANAENAWYDELGGMVRTWFYIDEFDTRYFDNRYTLYF